MERKRSRIAERDRNTPVLDEERLLKWADANIFRQRHYLYYKKRGRYADLCCSACGGVYSGAWKEGESYESGFGRSVREAELNINDLFVGEHDAAAVLRAAVHPIAICAIDSVTVNIGNSVKATMRLTSKGKIQIKKTKVSEDMVEG